MTPRMKEILKAWEAQSPGFVAELRNQGRLHDKIRPYAETCNPSAADGNAFADRACIAACPCAKEGSEHYRAEP